MSLRFALLGLLDARPATGYELTHRFAEGIDRYAWSAKHSQIYPELRRLTDDGLTEVVAEGARGSRTYGVTAAGREALREWLLSKGGPRGARNEFVLRLFLLGALEPDEARAVLERVVAHSDRQADELAGVLEYLQKERSGDGAPAGIDAEELAAQYGAYIYRASSDWAQWALDQIDRSASGG